MKKITVSVSTVRRNTLRSFHLSDIERKHSKHSDKEYYHCNMCDKSFKKRDVLQVHKKNSRTVEQLSTYLNQ